MNQPLPKSVIVIFLFGLQWPVSFWAEEIKIPLVENYDIKTQANKFALDVRQFIQENPDSKFIPRLCYDLHLAAIASADGKLIKLSKSHLVMEAYPSVYSRHFLSSITDAEQMQTLIKDVNDVIDTSNKEKVGRICELTRLGFQKYRAEIMGKNIEFPVIVYVHSRLAEDDELNGFAKNVILKQVEKNDEYKTAVDLLLSDKTPFEKYVEWHQLKTKLGGFMMNLYFDYLSEAEKSLPDIIISRLKDRFDQKDFIELLTELEGLPKDKKNSVSLLVLKGMVLFALKKDQAAIKVMDQSVQVAAKKSDKVAIRKYIQTMKNFDENKKIYGTIIPEFANTFLGGELRFEADLSIQEIKEAPFGSAYLAMDLSKNTIEMQIRKGEKLTFAYRVKSGITSIYIESDGKIVEYDGIVMYPLPSISLSKDPDGGFSFLMGFTLTSDISQLSLTASKLFGSPYLSSSYGFGQFFEYTVRTTSSFMLSPIAENDVTKLEMGSFDWENLKLNTLSFSLDKDYAITEIAAPEGMSFKRVYLGADREYNFSPPPWPEKPVERRGEFDQSEFLDLFGRIMKIVSSVLPE